MVPATLLASIAGALAGWPSPLEATAERLMEWTPVGPATFLLLHLGAVSRPAALLGALAVAMLAGGIAAMPAAVLAPVGRWRTAGLVVSGALVAWVFLALFPPSNPAPELALVAAFVLALAAISHRPAPAPGRREFLARSGVILGGAAALVALFATRPLLRTVAVRRLFPYRPPRGIPLAGLTEPVTPTARFYVMDKVLQYPEIGPPAWRLTIDGAVAAPLSIDFRELLARPVRSRYVTLECVDNPVGGPLISTALWTGASMAALLSDVGARGDTLVFHSADRYAESVPRRDAERAGAMVAYAMNGVVLPRAHGYPARAIIPGLYGFKNIKWLERIEVAGGSYDDEWRGRGWTAARIHTTTRIDVARRQAGSILVAGIAFAGNRGIRAVEVRANGGPWYRATLGPPLSDDAWVQWVARLPDHGTTTVDARAIDGTGRVQDARRRGAFPDGATGWASATV